MQVNTNNFQLPINTSLSGNNTLTNNPPSASQVVPASSEASFHSRESQPLTSTPRAADADGAENRPLNNTQNVAETAARQAEVAETNNAQQTQIEAVEREQVRQLATRDREVRQHEQAHATVGGRFAGAPSYEFERGPDGNFYAIGGEVRIDTSAVPNDPQATLEKAEVVLRAALAVAEPSGQDQAVAAQASALAAQARSELANLESSAQQNVVSPDTETNTEAAEVADNSVITEQQQRIQADQQRAEVEQAEDTENVRLDEQRQQQEADAVQRSDNLTQLRDAQAEQAEAISESLEDYTELLEDVRDRFAEVNQRLIDAGVFQKLIPEGFIIDQSV